MTNIYEYLKTNNKSFKEEPINEIDKVILSLIPYIDFSDIVNNPILLKDAIKEFLKIKDKKEFNKKALFDKDVYTMIEILNNNKRYQDIIQNAKIDIFVSGNFDENQVVSYVEDDLNNFKLQSRIPIFIKNNEETQKKEKVQTKVLEEKLDFVASTINELIKTDIAHYSNITGMYNAKQKFT